MNPTCPRCHGLLALDTILASDQQYVEALGMVRCLLCGWRMDPTIEANQMKVCPIGKIDKKLHHRKFTHEIIAVTVKK